MNLTVEFFPRCIQGLYCILTTPVLLDIARGPKSDEDRGLILKLSQKTRGISVNLLQT